jgi:hypothetical protein
MNSTEIVCYYKVQLTLQALQQSGSSIHATQLPLFSDEALTNQIGYTIANGTFFSNKDNILALYKCVYLIDNNIFATEYVKKNDDTTLSAILYSTMYKGNGANSGIITKEILADGLTRKVTIKANE